MIIERAVVYDAEEILALQKLAYISEAVNCNDFNIPPLVQTLAENWGIKSLKRKKLRPV